MGRFTAALRRPVAGAAAALLLAACALALPAAAQAFPWKPIRIVVPYPPGGFNDTLGRLLAAKLAEGWGQPAVVENKPGGNTVIGTEQVARAAPDGHTLLVVAFPFAVAPSLARKLGFDPVRDFAPIALAAQSPNLLVVHPAVPVKSVAELIAYARAHPGRLAYASTGSGASNHIAMELFKSMAGVDILHVPYKGSGPAVSDVLGGQVPLMFDNAANVLPYVKTNRLRALAVSGARRSPIAPEVPTVAEAGLRGYDVMVWFGLVAPAGTPPAVVARLNARVIEILALPEVRERFLAQGVEPLGSTPEAFGAHIRSEMARWGRVVREAGVQAE
jgi:tripartite-type tricarboxylate transporter receptor subunit TctC